MATGNFIPSFHAAQGNLKFSTSAVTYDETSALSSKTHGNTIIQCKNITVTPPKGDVEIVQLFGVETVTVGASKPAGGTWQNSVFDEKSWTEASVTATLVLVGDNTNIPDFVDFVTGTGISLGASGYTRHTYGSSDSNETRTTVGSVILELNNGAEEVAVVLAQPFMNFGELKPTGMDGHFEVDFEAKCLPKNFAIDFKD